MGARARVVYIPGPPSSPRAAGYYDYRIVSDDKVQCCKRGRKTHVYTLERTGSSWSCNCVGYVVHRECKHSKYCPFSALPLEGRKESLGILANAAKGASVVLQDGRSVNCYDTFWESPVTQETKEKGVRHGE